MMSAKQQEYILDRFFFVREEQAKASIYKTVPVNFALCSAVKLWLRSFYVVEIERFLFREQLNMGRRPIVKIPRAFFGKEASIYNFYMCQVLALSSYPLLRSILEKE